MAGLSEEEKKKHPFLIEKRFMEAVTKEYKEAQEKFYSALQDYVYEALNANFKAHKGDPSVMRVIEGTSALIRGRFETILNKDLAWLTEKMLERFDLVKKK